MFKAILLSILCTFSIYAQKTSLYGSFGFCYPTTGEYFFASTDNSIILQKPNYAKGYIFSVGFIYQLNENFGLDLKTSYMDNGGKTEIPNKDYDLSFTSSNFNISPAFLFETEIWDITPFAKFGGSINFAKVTEYSNSVGDLKREYSTDFSLGLNASLGIFYPIGKSLNLIVEVSAASLTLYADKLHNTYNSVESDVDLKDSFTTISPGTSDIARSFEFSSLQTSVGLKFDI